MAHNFRVAANLYVSKAGRPKAAGAVGSAEDPFGLLQDAGPYNTVERIAVGAGQYEGMLDFQYAGGQSYRTMLADGLVVVQTPRLLLSRWDYGRSNWKGFHFRGPGIVENTNNGGPWAHRMTQCVFENYSFTYSAGPYAHELVYYFEDCVFYNCTSWQTDFPSIFIRCQFINTQWHSVYAVHACDVDAASQLVMVASALIRSDSTFSDVGPGGLNAIVAGILRSNIRSLVRSESEPDFVSFAAYAQAHPGVVFDSISQPPAHANPAVFDFSYLPDAPNLSRGIGPQQLRTGVSLLLQGPVGPVTATSGHFLSSSIASGSIALIAAENLEAFREQDRLYLRVAENREANFTGSFRTAPIQLGSAPRAITYLDFLGGLNMDTDYPAQEDLLDANQATALNNNVPAVESFPPAAAGRNPRRLTVLLRWSNKVLPQQDVATDWVTGSDFVLFELGQPAKYNPVTRTGNGSPEFLASTATSLGNAPRSPIGRWVQLQVVLRNDYYSH